MLLWIKIAVLYGAPIIAVLVAIVFLVVLLLRVRRGAITRGRAAAVYPVVLLLPVATLLIVWGTAEIASYLAVPSGRYAWDASAALDVLVSLLPIAGYVAAPIALLVVALWITLWNTHTR
jgi:hypothetical protein